MLPKPPNRVAYSVALLLLSLASRAQDTSPIAAPPADPRLLLVQALKVNDLTASPIQPWHIRASYQLFDNDSGPQQSGTFEEWWSSPTKYKRSFIRTGFVQTDYITDDGVFRTGSTENVDPLVEQAIRELIQPIPSEEAIEKATLTFKRADFGGAKFNCVRIGFSSDFCLGIDPPILRVTALGPEQLLHNRILRFQNHFVPGDLKMVSSGQTVFTVHVDTIDELSADTDFTPPSEARLQPRAIDAAVAHGLCTYAPPPEYPMAARHSHTQGTVVVQAIIGIDGKLSNLKAISGPDMLKGSALQALRTWRYRPYVFNGKPVEVMTTINVIFAL